MFLGGFNLPYYYVSCLSYYCVKRIYSSCLAILTRSSSNYYFTLQYSLLIVVQFCRKYVASSSERSSRVLCASTNLSSSFTSVCNFYPFGKLVTFSSEKREPFIDLSCSRFCLLAAVGLRCESVVVLIISDYINSLFSVSLMFLRCSQPIVWSCTRSSFCLTTFETCVVARQSVSMRVCCLTLTIRSESSLTTLRISRSKYVHIFSLY